MKVAPKPSLYDSWLLLSGLSILGLGLLMVTSSSIVISERAYGFPFYYVMRQGVYIVIGLMLGYVGARIPLHVWEKLRGYCLMASYVLLVAVLIPGIGREVNGSMRWIIVGPISIQASELVKIAVIIYLSGYLVQHQEEVETRIRGFLKPLLVVGGLGLLLLQEPDFGATAVIVATALGLLFLAGVKLWQFVFLMLAAASVLAILAISEPYRMLRLTTFLHPWSNPFDTGYQLTQSLIAFGRGGIWGVGLGNSVQKLFYLPEAHTDFLFAVLGEELGLLGQIAVVALFAVLVGRALFISRRAQRNGQLFNAYLGYGIALCLALQVMINIGVNLGILPTKGLTLPLMSYGGSSLWVNCFSLGILLRLGMESQTTVAITAPPSPAKPSKPIKTTAQPARSKAPITPPANQRPRSFYR
jgi:cell division protein FtsW